MGLLNDSLVTFDPSETLFVLSETYQMSS